MYRAIVKSKVRKTFEELSKGNNDFLISQFASDFSYRFVGDTSLSGLRTSEESMRKWFDRLDVVFSDLSFNPVSVEVGGMPWNTTVLSEVEVCGKIAGQSYSNLFFQRVTLKFGKIISIVTLEDTKYLSDRLESAAQKGVTEATAEPIVDA